MPMARLERHAASAGSTSTQRVKLSTAFSWLPTKLYAMPSQLSALASAGSSSSARLKFAKIFSKGSLLIPSI